MSFQEGADDVAKSLNFVFSTALGALIGLSFQDADLGEASRVIQGLVIISVIIGMLFAARWSVRERAWKSAIVWTFIFGLLIFGMRGPLVFSFGGTGEVIQLLIVYWFIQLAVFSFIEQW